MAFEPEYPCASINLHCMLIYSARTWHGIVSEIAFYCGAGPRLLAVFCAFSRPHAHRSAIHGGTVGSCFSKHAQFFHSAKYQFPPYPEKWNGVVYPKSLQEEKKGFESGTVLHLEPFSDCRHCDWITPCSRSAFRWRKVQFWIDLFTDITVISGSYTQGSKNKSICKYTILIYIQVIQVKNIYLVSANIHLRTAICVGMQTIHLGSWKNTVQTLMALFKLSFSI